MATELKTTLELDIKPFLDAIKKAVNNLKVLEDLRPKVNSAELQKLVNQLNSFNPQINVGLNIDRRELNETEQEINQLGEDPVRVELLVNSEEIQTSVNRVRELRGAALNIPPKTDLQINDNLEEVTKKIGGIKFSVDDITSSEKVIKFTADDTGLKFSIDQIKSNLLSLQDVNLKASIDSNSQKVISDTINKLRQLEEGKVDIEFNDEEIKIALGSIQEELNRFKRALTDIPGFTPDIQGLKLAAPIVKNLSDELNKLQKSAREVNAQQLRQIFPEVDEQIIQRASIELNNIGDAIDEVKRKARDFEIDLKIDEAALNRITELRKETNLLPDTERIFIDVVGEENVKRELNQIEKDVKEIPNQKNINVNIDRTGVNNIQKTTTAIGGFTKQLGSGLIASFSGAAIGAAIAGFATQAVRGIGQAIKTADQLQDALKLAFTQVGAPDIEQSLQRANFFALELSNNFGVSVERSKTLLAQVIGLSGEFGTASENITQAAIGIEAATGGLVKAEQAARLFSRSIGNPEDQAALDTLARRFPAIGDAIRSTTEPAERANAVIANLSGTFAALNEDSQDLFSTLQRLGDTFTTVFGVALQPIADALAPAFQQITDSLLANTDSIAAFGQNIADNFVRPFLDVIQQIGPQFNTFLAGIGETLSIFGQVNFDLVTSSLKVLGVAFEIVGNTLIAINPLVQNLAQIISQILQPIVQSLTGGLNDLDNPLSRVSGGLLDFSDNAFALTPVIETLSNLVDLLNPVLTLLGNIIYLTVIPALDALEIQLGLVLLPFRLLNGAFELGKQLASDFGFSIDGLATNLAKLSLFLPPLLQIAKLLSTIGTLSSQPLGQANIGDTKPIEELDATLFDATDQAQKFNQQFGVVIPKGLASFGNSIKTASGATKETSSALATLLKSYENLSKVIGSRFDIEIAKNELIQKQQQENAGRQLTSLENIFFEQLKITAELEKQSQLEEEFAGLIGVRADSLSDLANQYLATGDLATLPISFNPNDPQSVEEARKIAETIVKLVTDRINLQARESEYKFDLTNVELQLDRDVITTQFNAIQEDIQRQLSDLQFGRISLQGFDLEGIRSSLTTIRDSAQNSLKPFEDRLKTTRAEIESLTNELNLLKASGGENSTQFTQLQGKLRIATDSFNTLNSQTQIYRDTVQQTQSQLENLGNTLEEAISNRLQRISQDFQRLGDRQQLEITVGLNTEGVNEGLIEIERNFARSINAIQQNFAEIEGRLRIEQNAPTGPLQQAEQLATAQEQALRNIATQRELAIRQFRLQNDAFFAINEALRNNLASALSPNTTAANRAFNERKRSLDSELELLRTNLDLGVISYQEYNTKVLDLEKQKADSIKQLEEETNQARLEGLQRIANEALPAIQNQLIESNIELTNLLQEGSAGFTDVANKTLETIGLVAAQSLALAIQQAQSLEEVQKLFIRNIVSGLLKVLNIQLTAAIIGALLTEVQQKSFLGLATGAIIGGIITGLFAVAEAKILQQLGGFESGGYTGDVGTKQVAGVVHGQEFVVNARGTKGNRELLEWLNKGKSAESFFNNSVGDIKVDNYVDTKAINSSINTLAYTMDARLSSLETTVDRAIRQNATLTKSANQLDVSVYSDPGTAIKYMKKIGKIKGLT